jgi:lycopene cyclase CruA
VGFERILAIGDAASLQSPLIFTGFGTLVRNLPRLTTLIDQALRLEQLDGASLNQVRASQANVTVTWLFSRGMMVPPGRRIAPQAINAMLNVFFGVLATGDPAKADAFMKDRAGWLAFTSMALVAAWRTPKMLLWILDLAGPVDLARWLVSYLEFSLLSLRSLLLAGWLPQLELALRPQLEARWPALALGLNALAFDITDGIGRPRWQNLAPLPKQGR